jgi:predicted AlkP superfamily pyrophosphatase or phosphodiesterase
MTVRSGVLRGCLLCLSWMLAITATHAQQPATRDGGSAPRLAVGIVVDQMQFDMLHRFEGQFGDGGFRRLLDHGFSFENARFDYAPTFTGPGHASVYTGTTPAVHGIMSNAWYVRELGRSTYVTDDDSVTTVGSDTDAGRMSPRWMLTTTVGDELWLHSNERSRVIAMSLKDRGAILPAGHTGEGYWFDYDTGDFITSTWYRDELPAWVRDFNARELVAEYLTRTWTLLLPEDQYAASLPDDNPYEAPFAGMERPVFPYDLSALAERGGPGIVAYTPYGDELLVELAIAAIDAESLGTREVPDLLAVSFSSPDHIGHRFGPMSKEIHDTFVRLDRQLARLLEHLDQRVGRDNYIVFLTADHGVAHVPDYLADRNIPVGRLSGRVVAARLREHLGELYGDDFILTLNNEQVFFDHDRVRAAGVNLTQLQEETARFLVRVDGIAGALTSHALMFNEFREGHRALIQRGFNPARSGDVVYWMEPHWLAPFGGSVATTHGSPYSYDTRAPLIWYGAGVPHGRSAHPAFISDIASTLAIFLRSPFPSGNTGNPLNELMRQAD